MMFLLYFLSYIGNLTQAFLVLLSNICYVAFSGTEGLAWWNEEDISKGQTSGTSQADRNLWSGSRSFWRHWVEPNVKLGTKVERGKWEGTRTISKLTARLSLASLINTLGHADRSVGVSDKKRFYLWVAANGKRKKKKEEVSIPRKS